jgi:hypothetical protein
MTRDSGVGGFSAKKPKQINLEKQQIERSSPLNLLGGHRWSDAAALEPELRHSILATEVGGELRACPPDDLMRAADMANIITLHSARPARPPRGRRMPAPPLDLAPIEVKSSESWRYQWHRLMLERDDLTRSEIAVCGALMHAFRIERGYAEIALSTLAAHAGCSRRSAITATQRLRDLGLIVAVNEGQRVRGQPTMATHRYRLTYRDRGVA